MLHYEAGVGTRRGERLVGGVFGIGLSRNVQDCYRFLVENYEPGDKLYFLGFSRGAYTARSTVGLVRNAGILRPEQRDRIKQAYALYRNPERDSAPGGIAAELFRRSYSHSEVYVDFVGVWDTVGALGIPIDGFRPPWLSRLWTFHDPTLSRYVRNAYHALAIDERRRPFRPTLWVQQDDAENQTLEQVWFTGLTATSAAATATPGFRKFRFCGWPRRHAAAGSSSSPTTWSSRNDRRGRSSQGRDTPDAGPCSRTARLTHAVLPTPARLRPPPRKR